MLCHLLCWLETKKMVWHRWASVLSHNVLCSTVVNLACECWDHKYTMKMTPSRPWVAPDSLSWIIIVHAFQTRVLTMDRALWVFRLHKKQFNTPVNDYFLRRKWLDTELHQNLFKNLSEVRLSYQPSASVWGESDTHTFWVRQVFEPTSNWKVQYCIIKKKRREASLYLGFWSSFSNKIHKSRRELVNNVNK